MKNKKGHIATFAMCPFTIYGFKRFVNTNEIHQLRLRCFAPRTKGIVALIGGENDERNNGMYFCCIYYNIWNGSCQ
jgi:hypothetical protein